MFTWFKQLLGIGQTPELFSLTVDHHADITGRGKLVFGTVAAGNISLGDTVFAHTAAGVFPVVVTGVELEQQLLNEACEGQTIALLLRGKLLHQIQQGDLLSHSEAAAEQ